MRPRGNSRAAAAPFWAPDSKAIGFFADGTLKRVDVEGSSVRALTNAANATEGTWGRRDVILFSARGNPLRRVPAGGGDPAPVAGVGGANFSPHVRRHLLRNLFEDPRDLFSSGWRSPSTLTTLAVWASSVGRPCLTYEW